MSNVNVEKLMLTQQCQVMRWERTHTLLHIPHPKGSFSESGRSFSKCNFLWGLFAAAISWNMLYRTGLLKERGNALIGKWFCVCFQYLSSVLNWISQLKVFNLFNTFSVVQRVSTESLHKKTKEMLVRFYRTRQWT